MSAPPNVAVFSSASTSCSGLTLPFSTTTVAFLAAKSNLAFCTPGTDSRASTTFGGQLTRHVAPETERVIVSVFLTS